jgi:flavin-dependent dehydrogenase
MDTSKHAVVLGAGLAGMLAASALAEQGSVTIVERDELPTGPVARTGIPQARHAHLMMSGGATVIDELLPGTVHRWLDAGAHRVGLPSGMVTMAPVGWLRRWPQMQFLIASSRDLLDWVVREQVLRNPRVTVRQATEVTELIGSAARVAGVQVRDRGTGATATLDADLVVDATGRGSQAPRWLSQLGLPAVPETVVDSGLAYASRIFRAPTAATDGFPVVNIQGDPRLAEPGRGGCVLPIEDKRWLVTLAGTRGGEPSTKEEEFQPFARSIRHPLIADLIESAEPLTPVYGSRSTVNRRRHFERLPHWPEGLVVLGDAAATFNPLYGHGMSVAAHQAAAVRVLINRYGLNAAVARRIQRRVGQTIAGAWAMATVQDIFYPDAIGAKPTVVTRALQRYVNRLISTANSHPSVARALLDTFTLSAPMTRLAAPHIALATLRGPRRPPLPAPPFTEHEQCVITMSNGSPSKDRSRPA